MDDLEPRYCEGCVRFLPVKRFRPRSKDGPRMKRCNDCHASAERDRRAARRQKTERGRLRKQLAALADERNRKRIDLLTATMLDDFGGLIGFGVAWKGYLADARQRGGLAMFRALQVALRLIERAQDQQPDASQMTDDELEAELSRFIRNHPELAADPSLIRSGL